MFSRVLFFVSLLLLSACGGNVTPVETRNSSLTQGSVQMNVVVGSTTKAQVLEVFGAPNITTRDSSGSEVWTYQRSGQAAESSSKSGGWTVLLAGQSYSNSGFATSSRMITLIITFNSKDVVSDFSSRTSDF